MGEVVFAVVKHQQSINHIYLISEIFLVRRSPGVSFASVPPIATLSKKESGRCGNVRAFHLPDAHAFITLKLILKSYRYVKKNDYIYLKNVIVFSGLIICCCSYGTSSKMLAMAQAAFFFSFGLPEKSSIFARLCRYNYI